MPHAERLADRLAPYLEPLRRREVTNRAVARELGVSEEHVCRVLKQLNVVKDAVPDRKKNAELYRTRQAFRRQVAKTLPVAEAARQAGCSTRTIYRLRSLP